MFSQDYFFATIVILKFDIAVWLKLCFEMCEPNRIGSWFKHLTTSGGI
ncbi:4803_t:CDS:2 [Entrophospora sp. SA101]|nr:4803_t:CDS:2 [Entrophospora sp. SA101]